MSKSTPRILLHIGTHKTGTTSLQAFFFLNRDQLKKSSSILYPETGSPRVQHEAKYGHHLLAWSILQCKGVNDLSIWDEERNI